MRCYYRDRIVDLARSQRGRSGPYNGNPHEWCGSFACWVLRSAGLQFEEGEKQGATLCSQLTPTKAPLIGDIMCYAPVPHYGIITRIDGITFETIDGGMGRDLVTERVRAFGSRSMVFYSIEPLIQRFEMTGARTGEVA